MSNPFAALFGNSQQQQPQQQQPQPAAQQQQPAQAAPGNLPESLPNPPDASNPTVPQASQQQAAETPLDKFKDLWETASNNSPQGGNDFELTADKLMPIMQKADFSRAVTPEQLAAITAGGEGAAQAFVSAMNNVVQQAMVQATLINNKLAQQQITSANKGLKDSLPNLMRSFTSNEAVRTSNPMLSNPAIKPVVEAAQAQLLQRYPNATTAEISQMVNDYITAMGEQFAPKSATNQPSLSNPFANGNDTDWELFLR